MTARYSQRQIEEARSRRALSAIVGREVELIRRGGEFVGLCPFHKERTPSFTVVDAKGFYHCFGCGAHGDAIDWHMQIYNESFAAAVEALTGACGPSAREIRREEEARRAGDDQVARNHAHTEIARRIWHEASPIAGTPGEGYFRGRGVTMSLPPTLRFHPRVLHGPKARDLWLPAVICAVQDLAGGVTAVHRIYLDPATLRATPNKTTLFPDKALLGQPREGAIRLAAAAPRLGRCEGVETGLSIQQATGMPIWSAISGGHMAKMALPAIVAEAVTFADRDPVCWQPGPLYGKRPGEHYALQAAARDRAAGRRALIVAPPGNKEDFNDLLQETG